MVRWVSGSNKKAIFDPAFGLGAFWEQLPRGARDYFRAMEVDPKVIDFWTTHGGRSREFVSIGNYLDTWGQSHENIVCNPPYMRFQKFRHREVINEKFEHHVGVRLSGYTNTASAFLIKSLYELDAGGRLAYIMPLEFLNTGYGKIVKKKLLEHRSLFGIISLDCEKEVFPDATTSVGIILVDKSKRHDEVRFYSLDRVESLVGFQSAAPISEVDYRGLDPDQKWLPYFRKREFSIRSDRMTALNFYGCFSRGIATGANEFFALSRTKILRIGLDEYSYCRPCITKSSQIKGPFFGKSDLEQLKNDDRPVFLFSVNGAMSGCAREYIKDGEKQGFNERYLTRNRNPWYKTEARESASILLGVFSRGGYKIVRNTSGALNLTCFHGFHPNLFGANYQEHLFLYLSSDVGRQVVSLVMRKYGDSLDKFEPNDINDALVPSPEFFESIPMGAIESAMSDYRATNKVPDRLEREFERIWELRGSIALVSDPPR